ncbi:MAG: 5-oxoprolinase subunit PxpB [Bryobacteraceae bacterium]
MPLGDAAVVVRVGDSLGKVLATAHKLEAARLPGVIEVAPAFASVALFLETPRPFDDFARIVQAALRRRFPAAKLDRPPRLLEVPVCYEREYGLDLDLVAQHCRLSPNEIARSHSGSEYRVRCIGFSPGFPYLSKLPRALAMPRRATPRTEVPAGSVAIGGTQTGIYPLPSPGGWNIIGRTPLRLFDPAREPAALLRAGDRVRFITISRAEFERWEK